MNNEKVTQKVQLPHEVAEAIDSMREEGMTNYRIMYQAEGAAVTKTYLAVRRWAFERDGGSPDLLMCALVNGYEVEKTPEEKIRVYYNEAEAKRKYAQHSEFDKRYLGRQEGVRNTLDLLGVKITGVNAP